MSTARRYIERAELTEIRDSQLIYPTFHTYNYENQTLWSVLVVKAVASIVS
jgi:hypothetical protein